MKPTHRYSTAFFLTAGLSLAAVGGFNILIDPDHLFRLAQIPGFNAEKPLVAKHGMRKAKAVDLATGTYDTLLLGTSRTLGGLDPEHLAFGDSNAYNAALSATNFYETLQVYQFARQHQQLKHLIIELDFTGFSDWATTNADFDDSRFSGKNHLPRDLKRTLSFGKLSDTITTIKFNRSGQQGQYSDRGFRRFRIYGDDDTAQSAHNQPALDHRPLFTWATQEFIKSHNRQHDSGDRLALLQQLLAQAHQDGTQITLFISPLHAHLLEGLHQVNQYDDFEQWKREIVTLVESTPQPDQPKPTVWDFSGYNSITTEAIPPESSNQAMEWYAESSHYTAALGDIMLEQMLIGQSASAPADFGIQLTSDNLEQHMAVIEADRQLYYRTQPQEIAEVTRLAQEVLKTQQARR